MILDLESLSDLESLRALVLDISIICQPFRHIVFYFSVFFGFSLFFSFSIVLTYTGIRLTKWLASRNGQFHIFVNNSFLNTNLGGFVVTI